MTPGSWAWWPTTRISGSSSPARPARIAARTRSAIIETLPRPSAGARPSRARIGPVTSGNDAFTTGPAYPAARTARITESTTGSW